MNNIKPFGKRVLVKKEKLDAGGLRLTPTQEEDGQKNFGRILAVGDVGLLAQIRGIRVGAKIYFRKFFVHNDGQENSAVFVDLDAITGVEKEKPKGNIVQYSGFECDVCGCRVIENARCANLSCESNKK